MAADDCGKSSFCFSTRPYEVQYRNNFSGEEFYDTGKSVGFAGVAFANELTR